MKYTLAAMFAIFNGGSCVTLQAQAEVESQIAAAAEQTQTVAASLRAIADGVTRAKFAIEEPMAKLEKDIDDVLAALQIPLDALAEIQLGHDSAHGLIFDPTDEDEDGFPDDSNASTV